MGALVSYSVRTRHNSSPKGRNEKPKRKIEVSQGSGRNKRSSVHRPVLQLQVKSDTMDRVRRRAGSNGSVMMSRSALESLARESPAYENLFPARQSFGSSSHHTHHSRHHSTGSHGSQDSMVLLQIVEDGKHLLISEPDENDYDHLLPRGDFSHLCACTYGSFDEVHEEEEEGEGEGEEPRQGGAGKRRRGLSESDTHTTTMQYGRGRARSILMTSGLSAGELKLRIRNHQSPVRELEGSFRRSKSASTLATYQLTAQDLTEQKTNSQSTRDLDNETSDYWTLGESIIRTLSRRDMMTFDIDNPQSRSEHEIIAAWPGLREKLNRSATPGVNGWV